MTLEQKACNFETMRHIERVRNILNNFVVDLLGRGELHDQSKLESPDGKKSLLLLGWLVVSRRLDQLFSIVSGLRLRKDKRC